ncbi:Metallo-beta-lactamase superfamily protein [Paenibacillus sp. yr247]|uniref:MBL fold metallo-hydrolase n=1 Tax=Paenibacillus sp. yr247 TaxID=1761880 RepID=UPI000884FAA5|nr:Metallo-beta-lactamase superfamily protein [Paenibacillus sp. yr247]
MDTGYPGLFPLIREAIEQNDVPFRKLNTIIITHQDIDHIGSLPNFISESPNKLAVLSSEIEKPYIQGEKMLIKITPQGIIVIHTPGHTHGTS